MDIVTYDKNIARQIALVAENGCINPRYIDLGNAPEEITTASYFQLRQMHTSASGVIDGQVAHEMDGFVPDEWQTYGHHHRIENSSQEHEASKIEGKNEQLEDPSNATESNL